MGFDRLGFFNEPSHFALYIIPIISYRLLMNYKDPLSHLSLLVSVIFIPSTTLLVAVMLLGAIVFVININVRPLYSLIIVAVFIFIFVISLISGLVPLPDASERIEGLLTISTVESIETVNLSSLVWLNGWSQGFQTVVATNGLGLGFNQMGCGSYFDIGEYTQIIQGIFSGGMLNAEDGSLLFAKLVAEFGVIGLLIACFLTYKSLVNIHSIIFSRISFGADKYDQLALKATGSIIILILLFVRSGPYFLLPVVLGISLLCARIKK